MHVTMVKKRLADGETCRKCAQAEDLLRSRGLWKRIDEVIWADERDATSAGAVLAAHYGVDSAPFFVVRDGDEPPLVYTSVLKLVAERLAVPDAKRAAVTFDGDVERAARDLADRPPPDVLRWGLERFGESLGIAFSGAEDVVLIHMAKESGLPFSVFCLDTGRLHPETYRFIDAVRKRYGVPFSLYSPQATSLERFVRQKGLFSFYDDGHEECCGIRKVEPLRRALAPLRAWATGQRRDQSPATRAAIAVVEPERTFEGPQLKLNPLAAWSSAQTWAYIREQGVPYNSLHERGFVSIGCEPCTRAVLPGEHERGGRWWWEEKTKRECGLHIANARPSQGGPP
jgi:phosphoadenosine phosphosulfate reductase